MGMSSDAILCFGFAFEEDFEFPWYDAAKEEELNFNDWWLRLRGFKPSKELYDKVGEWIDGREPMVEDVSRYYEEKRAFIAADPPPVELVTHNHYDYPMTILAVPGSVVRADQGEPLAINTAMFNRAFTAEQLAALIQFCEQHNIVTADPQWWLCSMYG